MEVKQIKSPDKTLTALVYNGQLISILKNNKEYMHGGGKPKEYKSEQDFIGWQNSSLIMFPIVGPTNEKHQLTLNSNSYSSDQHGISRTKNFELLSSDETSATYIQTFKKGEKNLNSKYKCDHSHPKYIEWINSSVTLEIICENEQITANLTITNNSNETMKYNTGWHPAFKIHDETQTTIQIDQEQISLNLVQTAPGCVIYKDATNITLNNSNSTSLQISSKDFSKYQIWSKPGDNLCCIEPVTAFPANDLNYFNENQTYETLDPNQSKTYSIKIIPK